MRLYRDSDNQYKVFEELQDCAYNLADIDDSALDANSQALMQKSDCIFSCQLFFPLRQRYWEVSKIPKVISTNTDLQGIYGYSLKLENVQLRSAGVLLLMYVWEERVNKFIEKTNERTFAQKCLQEVDEILLQCKHIGELISPFVEQSQLVAIQRARIQSSQRFSHLYPATTCSENHSWVQRHLLGENSPFALEFKEKFS